VSFRENMRRQRGVFAKVGEGSNFRRLESGKRAAPDFVSNPDTRSFWMILKCSSIVIINLIATLSFLYHKSEKPAVIRLD